MTLTSYVENQTKRSPPPEFVICNLVCQPLSGRLPDVRRSRWAELLYYVICNDEMLTIMKYDVTNYLHSGLTLTFR